MEPIKVSSGEQSKPWSNVTTDCSDYESPYTPGSQVTDSTEYDIKPSLTSMNQLRHGTERCSNGLTQVKKRRYRSACEFLSF